VDKVIHCDCGFDARSEDEERLVAEVQHHAREAHGMTLSHDEALLLVFRAQLDLTATEPQQVAMSDVQLGEEEEDEKQDQCFARRVEVEASVRPRARSARCGGRRADSHAGIRQGRLGWAGNCRSRDGGPRIKPGGMGLQDDLAQVRAVTARFHDVDAALDAGYELGWVNGSGQRIITGCVFHPTAGAMGYHYFNAELMADLTTDALQPEALVYAPGEDGSLKLAAVEWVVRGPNSNPPGTPDPPSVLGMQMHILNPAVGFWLMHAWVWKPNPAGMFADWNPDVSCP
jgi:Protein of unknown function (DUF1059)